MWNKTRKVQSVPEHTQAFFANSELLIEYYVSYLTLDNFSFQLYKSCDVNIFFK
jgi:hypothetical protein